MAKILFVEDEASLREEIAEELTDAGHTVFQAGNGVEGFDLAIACKPDLILCDISMPEMDGRELLVELRENHPEIKNVYFIFVSALCDHQDMIEAFRLGADDYITKPVDFDILLIKVDFALRRIERMLKHKSAKADSSGTSTVGNGGVNRAEIGI